MRNQNSNFLAGTVMMSLVKRVLINRLRNFRYIKMKFCNINLSQISTFVKYIFPNIDF